MLMIKFELLAAHEIYILNTFMKQIIFLLFCCFVLLGCGLKKPLILEQENFIQRH